MGRIFVSFASSDSSFEMLISLNWIRDFCPFQTEETPLEVGTRFTLHTAEVEAAFARGGALGEIRAARVLAVGPHPNADRLSLVQVDTGKGEPIEVVCGAPNVRPGLIVPYAAPGVEVQGKKLRAAKVRGVLSAGMLCSEKELQVSEEAGGLWELPADATVGAALGELYPDLVDVVLEVDNKSLTHRPDLWGHYGIAREFATIYDVPLAPLQLDESLAKQPGTATIDVAVEGRGVGGRDGLCRRYCGLQIDGVTVAPSPPWLQHRLLAVGSRPINNIVDITNYILFELGQPLHAFDTQRVRGSEIRVRRAAAGEELRLIDDSLVKLEPEDLVIADAQDPVALAGIMGGKESGITDASRSIFFESANFSPVRVRRTSTRVGTRTDSSLRFEKSLDPETARSGVLRAAELVLRLCPGAKVTGALQDVGYEAPTPIEIRTTAAFINKRLGTALPADEPRAILGRLGFDLTGSNEGEWLVRVPSWRATKDVSIAEDLVEEVGRIYGYDNVVAAAPEWPVEGVDGNAHRRLERRAKQFLALRAGFCEVFTYPMVGVAHCQTFGLDPEAHLKIQHPLSEDMDRLRRELVPSLLAKAAENQRYGLDFGFFELGRVYRKPKDRLGEPELPDERSVLAGVASYAKRDNDNFYGVRDAVLSLLGELRVDSVEAVEATSQEDDPSSWRHPAVAACVLASGELVGRIFRIHPELEARLELKGDVLGFDLDFDRIYEAAKRPVDYLPPSRYPTVAFDVAVLAPARTPAAVLCGIVREATGSLFQGVDVFDVFEDAQLGTDKKSVALHVVFGSRERTLAGEEVAATQEQVMAALRAAGYPLR
jgi:phenylalanyl-tRNA synthetase beta chain